MKWEYFTEKAEKAKEVIKKLKRESDKIKEKYNSDWKLVQDELETPEELQRLNELAKLLEEVKAELGNVWSKAESTKIRIKFVGTTSSGKSSLINALLRSRRLPVGFMQTTMCSFEVCATEEKHWSAIVRGENGQIVHRSSSENENEMKVLLSKMSGKKHANDRKEMGIGTRTVVQVNWPKDQCKVLTEHVVLFDTPGLGEDDESDEVITESCREADIVVAVMDAMSPSKATVTKLVKNVNCKFTFGVFTKWDKCIRKEQEESEDTVDVHQTREDYKQNFHDALKGQCEMFFVDVKCENTNDTGFKEFEEKLQASATKLKCESLIEQAKSVNGKSIDITEKLKNIVDAKQKQKAATIEENRASMKKDKDSFNEMERSLEGAKELMEGVFNKNTKQIKDFEDGVRNGKPENEVHAEFIANVNECTRDALVRQKDEIRRTFIKWAENHKYEADVDAFVSDIDDNQLCEKGGLSKDEYNRILDPKTYYTNQFLVTWLFWGTVGGVLVGVPGVAGAGILALTRRLQSTPQVQAVGQLLEWILPISGYKVNCWRKKLQGNLKELDKRCKDLISNDIKRIKDKATEELKRTRVVKEKKIQDEERKSLKLDEWSKECQESHTRLTETHKEFDELLTEIQKDVNEPPPRETQPHGEAK